MRKVGQGIGKALTTEALVFNRQTKNFQTFYNTCCGYRTVSFSPSSLAGAVGGAGQLSILGRNGCTGVEEDLTLSGAYLSNNTSIATVNTVGGVAYVGPGGTTENSSITYFKHPTRCFVGFCECSVRFATFDTPTDVTPTVTITCNKPHLALGPTAPSTTKSGSCSAPGNPPGGSYAWGTTTNAITVAGGNAPSTTYSAAAEGQGQVTVTYTLNNRPATAESETITVHKPRSLAVDLDTTNPTGTTCQVECLNDPNQTCTYQSYLRRREYTVLDSSGTRFPSVGLLDAQINESLDYSSSCPNVTFTPGSSSSSTFEDVFNFCHTQCLPGGTGCNTAMTQTITANGLTVRAVSAQITCTGVTLTP